VIGMVIRALAGKGLGQHRMLLVPFEPPNLSSQLFESALSVAQQKSAELVLLCVRPPGGAMWYSQEDEHLFSDLKGLQARLGGRSVPVKIETVAGAIAQLVLEYTIENDTDMIMIPGNPLDAGAGVSV
jgi:K+-sensing histidine kinase KdpD